MISLMFFSSINAEEKDKVTVYGHKVINTPSLALPEGGAADIATVFNMLPGGAANNNGTLSLIPQYRGMFGPRLDVRVNGQRIIPMGPMWMDPPLHYAPLTLVEEFRFQRGVAPVSTSAGLGGNMNAILKQSRFMPGEKMITQGSFEVHGHSMDEGYNMGFFVGAGNDSHRFHVFGSRDEGSDAESAKGPIDGTAYERDSYGFAYGMRHGVHEFSLNYHRIITGDTGTPTLPMDINYIHGDFGKFAYKTRWGDYQVDFSFLFKDVEHKMSNYHFRSATDIDLLPIPDEQKLPPLRGIDRRHTDVTLEGVNAALKLQRAYKGGTLHFGLEAYSDDHNMEIFDPDFAPFFVSNFNDVDEDEIAVFAEWFGPLTQDLDMSIGIRYAHVRQAGDVVDALPARLAARPNNPVLNPVTNSFLALRDAFNNSQRTQEDDHLNVVLSSRYRWSKQLSLLASLAQTTRSPSYIERYLWVPLETNAGLGDGNNYVGDLNLDPEISRGFDIGFDWIASGVYFSPRIYHWWINDYIQGISIDSNECQAPFANAIETISCVNGDRTPKRFANVDAKIYGLDLEFGYRLNSDWRLDGIASITRGRRRDINDNLFRISPPKLVVGVTREFNSGNINFQAIAVAEQDKLAHSLLDPDNLGGNIDTAATPGYMLANIAASYRFSGKYPVTLSAGVNNIFDKYYQDHTSGFNRRVNSFTPIGQKIPGTERNVYLKLVYQW